MSEDLRRRAREWAEGDPDPETRAELLALVESGNATQLSERMDAPLKFGTAGLRGVVGAGPSRMNRAVVRRITRAVADHLFASATDVRTLPVVVGYDARPTSRAFAAEAVGVLASAGIPVRYFPEAAPTPLIAYAQRQLAGNAAIAVTASHNPAEYNGYKLYGPDAAQIAPPLDAAIAARLARIGPAAGVPAIAACFETPHPLVEPVPPSLMDRYVVEILALRPSGPRDRTTKIIYTPLHGVGWKLVERSLEAAGFEDVAVVPEQAEPDGRFPTAPFPNPEEPGVLSLAERLASESRADLVLANDPDADRLAVCIPTASGRWVRLSGNQVGVLLADFLLTGRTAVRPLVISTVVSSPLLARIAAAHGARYEETLTGFKWIWSAALELAERDGTTFVFGFEEALGYCIDGVVRDKDGISAALVFAELAAECKARGQSVRERLRSVFERYGYVRDAQVNIVRPGLSGAEEIRAAMERLTAAPPASVGGVSVTGCVDFRTGADHRPRWLAATSLVRLDLEGGGRVAVRPSGTEPKLKIYVDLPLPVESFELGGASDPALDLAHALAQYLNLDS